MMGKALELSCDLGLHIIQLAGYDAYYEEDANPDSEKYFSENLAKACEMAASASSSRRACAATSARCGTSDPTPGRTTSPMPPSSCARRSTRRLRRTRRSRRTGRSWRASRWGRTGRNCRGLSSHAETCQDLLRFVVTSQNLPRQTFPRRVHASVRGPVFALRFPWGDVRAGEGRAPTLRRKTRSSAGLPAQNPIECGMW